MGYEIDFLPVGKESKSGDAIALRYGDLSGAREAQRVIVIDGGFTDEGTALVDHVRKYYNTNRVDLVVSTHPDQDHVCGLKVVLENMEVGQLWMHLPWLHSRDLCERSKSITKFSGLSETLQKSLSGASDLEATARAKGIPIAEPFAGLMTDDGCFTVLGPTMEYYASVLAEIHEESLAAYVAHVVQKAVATVRGYVVEALHIETLTDDGETSPQNNTSAICLLTFDGRQSLFTGDAGVPALDGAATRLELQGFRAGSLSLVQVPHHGSRRNVGPTILNRLLGQPGKDATHASAFVSCAPKGEPKHPSKKVTNAFRRRGYGVHATQGSIKLHRHQAPPRDGWSDATPLPFYDQVEHDEDTA